LGGKQKRRIPMNCKRFISIIIVVSFLGTCLITISAMGQAKLSRGLALREEMVALEEAFETIIDAVIFSNTELIKPAIIRFHKTREKVEMTIISEPGVILPKNQDKFKEFVELDIKFHEDLASLEKAAEKGQKKLAKDQTHKLLDGCVVCHERFRK
jgi:cytochrome c556